jgi:ParB family chromosome partitioning protein
VRGNTRDIAAKAAGFGNGKTYEQAKAVIERGAPELVEAMDAGHVSVSAAATVASPPKKEQREIVRAGQAKEVARAARAAGKPKTGPKADAMRKELQEAQQRGVSMLTTYARLTLTAIRSSSEFTKEERELLAELEGAISQLRSVSTP